VERVLGAAAGAGYDEETEPYRIVLETRARLTRSPSIDSRMMRERARAALDGLPYAVIDTLHGLAGRIVRASALDLGLLPAFDVLDDDDARASVDAATEEVLSAALSRRDRAAVDLLDAGGGLAMTRKHIAELLDRADEEGLGIDQLVCTDMLEAARSSMNRLTELCEHLRIEGSRTLAEPALLAGSAARRWLDQGASEQELAAAFEPIFTRRSPARPLAPEQAFLTFREAIKGDTNAARGRHLAAFVAAAHELSPRARAMAALLSQISHLRSSERRRAGALGFGDLLRTARDAVRDDPEVALAARAMFDVLLVDEFQDTSRVQRDLVYLLREKRTSAIARAKGALPSAVDLEPTGLLIVGDRKQSIYGFRGADVTVFGRVCAELAGRSACEALCLSSEFEGSETPNAALVSLSQSRRSAPALLEFVNWFAEEDFGKESSYPFDIRYAESEHLWPAEPTDESRRDLRSASGERDHGPRVIVVDDRGDVSDDFPPLVRGASAQMREAMVAAGVVDRAVRDGSFGPLRHADIAILARRRATLPLLEFALARLAIPHIVAGRGLFETREVRDVFAVLRLVLDPYNRHALAIVLRGPAVGMSDGSLALLSEPGRGLVAPDAWFIPGRGVAERLSPDERARLRRFEVAFSELRSIGLGLGPADAIRYATEKLDLDRVMAALPRAAQHLGNVERLVELASQHGGSLATFVRWLEQQIADQGDESQAAALHDTTDAVTLMTIHASKGLEFPAVVLVDMGAGVRAPPLTLALAPGLLARPPRLVVRHTHAQGGSLFTPEAAEFSKEATARELAERRRLTYVAMTRARERLFLLVPPVAPNASAAATLRRLLPSLRARVGAVAEDAVPYLLRAPPVADVAMSPSSEPAPDAASPVGDRGALTISTTPLAMFDDCPRRYRFVHELGIDAPPFEGAPGAERDSTRDERRARGTGAHCVLERWPLELWGEATDAAEVLERLVAEGAPSDPASRRLAESIAAFLGSPYAARIRTGCVYREEPFVVTVESEGGSLHLRGAIDLLMTLPDGSAEVIDYKSSWHADPTQHEFQLRSYALAACRRYGVTRVRAGILNFTTSSEPTWIDIDDAECRAFEHRLSNLRASFLAARTRGDFPGIARPGCEALGCAFVGACHPS